MRIKNIINNLKLDNYSDVAVQDLGTRISVIYLNHLAMVRYHTVGLKTFDITTKEMSTLSELCGHLIDKRRSISDNYMIDYKENLMLCVNYISELKVKKANENSVKRDFQNRITMELNSFILQNFV